MVIKARSWMTGDLSKWIKLTHGEMMKR
jgi:hypothetical protein